VDTEFRNDPIVRVEVRGRKPYRVAAPISANNDSFYPIRATEHSARQVHAALRKQPADVRRTYPLSAENDLGNLVRDKPKVGAHGANQINISAPALAECESFSQIDLLRLESLVNDLAKKVFGRLGGKFLVECNNDRLLYSQHLEICEPLIERLQKRRGRLG